MSAKERPSKLGGLDFPRYLATPKPRPIMSQETCTDCLPPAQGASATPQPAAAPTASSSAALDPILDPSTFSPPYVQQNEFPRVEIEFCDRCKSPLCSCGSSALAEMKRALIALILQVAGCIALPGP